MKAYFLLLFLLIFSSCGYRQGQGVLPNCYSTIEVPYVEGDREGGMTSHIVHQLATTATFRYVRCRGDLKLCVKIIDFNHDNIGFRYDRNKENEITDLIIPVETRLSVLTEVKVIDQARGCVILGPARIYAYYDFDHDYYSSRGGVNEVSLGQLTDVDVAYESALDPLNRRIASKIVDFVVHSW